MKCLNCQEEISGNYCSNCGQRTSTKRITMNSVFENLLMGISNINRGFLYNLKALTLRPGATIMGYLEGKRIKLFHPVQYAIVGVTILTFVDARYGTSFTLGEPTQAIRESATYTFGYRFGAFLKMHLKYMWLLTILCFSLPAGWFFPKLNFAEHLTVQSFICGHATLLTAIIYPIMPWTFIIHPALYIALLVLMFFAYRKVYSVWEAVFLPFLILLIGLIFFVFLPATFLWLIY